MVWWQILAFAVALMSGPLGIVRDFFELYDPNSTPLATKRRFWSCVRIAFILSAAILIYSEHQKVLSLEANLDAARQPVDVHSASPVPPVAPSPAVTTVFPQTQSSELTTLSLQEIRQRVNDSPLLRREEALKDYVGLRVRWDCEILMSQGQEDGRIKLGLDCGHGAVTALVASTPSARLLRQDDKLAVSGTIAKDSSSLVIKLDPAEFTRK